MTGENGTRGKRVLRKSSTTIQNVLFSGHALELFLSVPLQSPSEYYEDHVSTKRHSVRTRNKYHEKKMLHLPQVDLMAGF